LARAGGPGRARPDTASGGLLGLAALRRLARASYGWFSPRLAVRAALAANYGTRFDSAR
jgi:hypothetical protein